MAIEAYPSDANLSLVRTWDDLDQLATITDGTNSIASYTRIGMRPKGTTFGNGATEARSYTGFRGEVASILHQTSGQSTIVQLDYGYNKMHSRTWERFGGSGSSGDGFAYDKLERLTNAWMGSVQPSSPSGQQYVKKIDYNYDDDGNRSSVVTTLWNQSPASTSYSTNNLNEYTSVGGTSQSHDANGNLTDNGTLQFKYDYKNLIVQVIRKSDSTVLGSYRYDALGRRVEKNTSAGVERHIRSIVGEPGRTVENFSHVVSTYDGSNNWQQNFVWSDEIDGIVMLEQADVLDNDTDGNTTEITRSYYHRNALGSVMEISDALEAVSVTYRYDPYGIVTITRGGNPQTSDPLGQHWTYTGRFTDQESGLLYCRARYYAPVTGRFIQRDPTGYRDGPSAYPYSRMNPLTHRDPSGHGTWERIRMVLAVGLLDAGKAKEAANAANKEAREEAKRRRLSGIWHNPVDAYKHCLWACLMSRSIGEDQAIEILTIHEEAGNASGQNENEHMMDWANNAKGILCAASGQDCIICCRKATLYWPLPPYPGSSDFPRGPYTPQPAVPWVGGLDGIGDSYIYQIGYMPRPRYGYAVPALGDNVY